MTPKVAALLLLSVLAALPRSAAAEAAPAIALPTAAASLVARARAAHLAEDPGWLRLGHWRRGLLGLRSEVDGREFFLAKDGKTDPAAELEATIAGLFSPGPFADELADPYCRFPARAAFLAARLGLDPAALPPRSCPKLDDFLARVRPAGVTLVFSSYYLNNPSSSFGHTLLRLDKAEGAREGKHFELLDYGVDYAATVDTSNAILYAAKGLFGLFKGEFKHYAYYYKVRQYGDFESRDLWEYDLALAPEETQLLARHLWELGGTWFAYWYLDENCSYHVLGALEAAAPRLDLLSHVGRAVVLPSDTLKALYANPGLVRAVHYRPSIRTQFEARARDLSGLELRTAVVLARSPAAPFPEALAPARRVAVLDAAQDLLDLKHGRKLVMGEDPAAATLRQALLERRAEIPVASAPLEVPAPEARRPDQGHGSFRVGLGGGAADAHGGYAALETRLALHDLADPLQGYPPTAQIEFLPARLRYYPEHQRLELDDASLVRVVSLNPLSRWDQRPSWRMRVGATTVRDGGCAGCLAGALELGGGLGAANLARAVDLLALGDTELLGSPRLDGIRGAGVRLGLGPSALVRIRGGERVVLLAEARWRYLPFATPEQTWALSGTLRLHLTRALSLALEARAAPEDRDVQAGVLVYR
ncbi:MULTISPECIES: DUF4105 domain-containing protein [Anaeromyxobacter]|uniref:Lnb N-terminal periplasmic domain-containing protein n=1 Tax=Anaeromyxobacter TaxID=161492 RepID=UPI001F5714D4|nr:MULTISPECIES: DUF4105 domain-containing protein [unclassified Anaeromyxobacter]